MLDYLNAFPNFFLYISGRVTIFQNLLKLINGAFLLQLRH
jgi:hypothetical protein